MTTPTTNALAPSTKKKEYDDGVTYVDSETGMHVLRDHKGTLIGVIGQEVDAVRIVNALNVMQMLDDYYPELVFENIEFAQSLPHEYAETLKADIATVLECNYDY